MHSQQRVGWQPRGGTGGSVPKAIGSAVLPSPSTSSVGSRPDPWKKYVEEVPLWRSAYQSPLSGVEHGTLSLLGSRTTSSSTDGELKPTPNLHCHGQTQTPGSQAQPAVVVGQAGELLQQFGADDVGDSRSQNT